jgi:all-trans-retinol 13,14-reductase
MPKSTALCAAAAAAASLVIVIAFRKQSRRYAFESTATEPVTDLAPGEADVRKNGFSKKKLDKVLEEPIDAVIIGSGMGGLTCAAMLSRSGKRVLVLEQHDVAGGCTHTFEDAGVEFDTGVHYVGGKIWEKAPNGSRLILDACVEAGGGLEWTRMDDVYDVATTRPAKWAPAGSLAAKGRRFEMRNGRGRLRADLVSKFPAEEAAIDAYFAAVQNEQSTVGLFFAYKILASLVPGWLAAATPGMLVSGIRRVMLGPHLRVSDLTVEAALAAITPNTELQELLTYHWGNYGLPPSTASFAIHCMVANHYFEVRGRLSLADPAAAAHTDDRARAPAPLLLTLPSPGRSLPHRRLR